MTHIGFVGLGHLGAPMAEQIVGVGFDVTLFSRKLATVVPFVGRVTIAPNLPELGRRAEIIGICVEANRRCWRSRTRFMAFWLERDLGPYC